VATFSQKKLFSYTTLVAGAIGISLMSMLVWLHHFFTMGAGGDVNAFFWNDDCVNCITNKCTNI
jgi:cytochrome o ubiquinol oxidase subunit 1